MTSLVCRMYAMSPDMVDKADSGTKGYVAGRAFKVSIFTRKMFSPAAQVLQSNLFSSAWRIPVCS